MSSVEEEQLLLLMSKGIYSERILSVFNKEIRYLFSDKDRVVLELIIDGTSISEIARCTRVEESTVKRRLRKIKEKLRDKIEHRVDNQSNMLAPKCPVCYDEAEAVPNKANRYVCLSCAGNPEYVGKLTSSKRMVLLKWLKE